MVVTKHAPQTADEAASLLHEAAQTKLAVVPVGGGRARGMGGVLEGCDVELHTSRLDRVIEHSQSDMVVSVEAGITLEALQEELGKAGQFLPLDPFNSPGHTIGGLLATGWTGPLRLRFRSPRDFLIGIRVALPDGKLATGGGRVVKNVSGYDVRELGWKTVEPSVWTVYSHRAPERWARIAVPRDALRRIVQALPSGSEWWASPGTGIAHWSVKVDAAVVRDMRARAEAAGGKLVMLAAPDDFMRDVGAWGTPPPTVDIMRRLKKAFDPDGVLNPGRFVV